MREYYYLTQLDKSPYRVSISDALHFGATFGLGIYVFIPEELELQFGVASETTLNDGKFLCITHDHVGAIEKTFVKQLNLNTGCELNDYHHIKKAFITKKYGGSIFETSFVRGPFREDSSNPYPYIVDISHPEYSVCVSDLLCWSDELESLANLGHIQRRDNGEGPTVTADENSKECTPEITALDDETEVKRLQRTVAALALGLAAKPGIYNKADKPNVSQLAKLATEHLRDGQNDRTPHGFSETTVRNTISAALKACPELKG